MPGTQGRARIEASEQPGQRVVPSVFSFSSVFAPRWNRSEHMNTALNSNVLTYLTGWRLPVLLLIGWVGLASGRAQEPPLVVRPEPAPRDDLELDADGDGIPDGWYNLRDVTWEAEGGVRGPHMLRFQNDKPGRPGRASRAFGIDGRKYEAVILGLWVRATEVAGGERVGEDPGLAIDFLDEGLRATNRGTLGPWTRSTIGEDRWVHVARKINVPPQSRDALMTLGLLGATGTLDVDGLTITLIPVGSAPTDELMLNGGLELANPTPTYWSLTGGARLVFPGADSDTALELGRAGARAQLAVAVPIRRIDTLQIRLQAKLSGLRGSGGGTANLYFLDEVGRGLPGATGSAALFRFSGSAGWKEFLAKVRVPAGAERAVVQIERTSGAGSLTIDDLSVTALPDPTQFRWTPDHTTLDTTDWQPYSPTATIEPGSALDASALLEQAKAAPHATVVQDGHLASSAGGRARFLGVLLMPPMATIAPDQADQLADNLARRGVNLVRFADLDAPYGPGRSLLDDTAEDTQTLEPEALAHFDHLVAALERQGIALSLELNSSRRFRPADGVADGQSLPQGGGPAIAFDPAASQVLLGFARALLEHVNPETGRALKDDPALAWVALSSEQSLFNLIDEPHALNSAWELRLQQVADKRSSSSELRRWQTIESQQWMRLAQKLRDLGLKCPIAGCAHWRREPEFGAAQAVTGLDLIDDHLFWMPPRFAMGDRLSLLFDPEGGLPHLASSKRKPGRPYAVSQWCSQTQDLWALPLEGADLLLSTEQARTDGWDALVRRGIFFQPETWGSAPPGTTGGPDLFRLAEVANANPAVFGLMPHAASLFLQPRSSDKAKEKAMKWDPGGGRLTIDTPHTAVLAGRSASRPARFSAITLESDTPTATVAASALGAEAIDSAKRLLITAIARVEPTGHTYADACRTLPGRPGGAPLLLEPVRARVTWKRKGTIKAYALDSAGKRVQDVSVEPTADGPRLTLDGTIPGTIHWELVIENP